MDWEKYRKEDEVQHTPLKDVGGYSSPSPRP